MGGLTENDLGDGDTGPNGLQNFPIITSAVASLVEGGTTITGRLNSDAEHDVHARLLREPGLRAAGRRTLREGQTYLGSTQVTTDGSGQRDINVGAAGRDDRAGRRVTATATDPDGNTSEFSQRIVFSSSPASGTPAGGRPSPLTGFHFLAGRHA